MTTLQDAAPKPSDPAPGRKLAYGNGSPQLSGECKTLILDTQDLIYTLQEACDAARKSAGYEFMGERRRERSGLLWSIAQMETYLEQVSSNLEKIRAELGFERQAYGAEAAEAKAAAE